MRSYPTQDQDFFRFRRNFAEGDFNDVPKGQVGDTAFNLCNPLCVRRRENKRTAGA